MGSNPTSSVCIKRIVMKKRFSAQECKSVLNAIADCIEQRGSFFTREELRELIERRSQN